MRFAPRASRSAIVLNKGVYSLPDGHVGEAQEVVAHAAQARQHLRERRHDQVLAVAATNRYRLDNISR